MESWLFCFFVPDFDGDDMIGKNDLKQVIQRLTGYNNALNESDIDQLITVSSMVNRTDSMTLCRLFTISEQVSIFK